MKTLKLLTTTAIFAGVLALSEPVQAQEQGWYGNMKNKVTTWFNKEEATTAPAEETYANAEVEAYLNEVTVAVPTMTATEAANIQPAAGGDTQVNYDEIESLRSASQSQTLNTDFDYNATVNAFNDPMSAEDFNNIETAAGDAEAVNDESVVVADENGDAVEINDESVVVAETSDENAGANIATDMETTVETDTVVTDTMDDEAQSAMDEVNAAADAKMKTSAEEVDSAVEEMDKAVEEGTSADVNAEVEGDMAVEPETSTGADINVQSTTVVE